METRGESIRRGKLAKKIGRRMRAMDSKDAIYQDFAKHGLSMIDAVLRLQGIGYDPKEAEQIADEWADCLGDVDGR